MSNVILVLLLVAAFGLGVAATLLALWALERRILARPGARHTVARRLLSEAELGGAL